MERLQGYLMSVKFSVAEMMEMEDMIDHFIKTEKLKISIPVDIFEVATNLGFDIRGAEFSEPLEGILIVDEFEKEIGGFNSNKVIIYNCEKDIYTKKFVVAHELAHYIYEKVKSKQNKIVVAARDHESESYSDDKKEQMMDYIAAGLLVPRNELIKYCELKKANAKDIALKYNVSLELAERRIEEVSYD
ncbi:MAG: ImmA/IrrE family metallo-endopeptidase [Bacteroides sp.]|nr:ImmA/IrrE family metallo-endopeptidase [Bacteroides sp.]